MPSGMGATGAESPWGRHSPDPPVLLGTLLLDSPRNKNHVLVLEPVHRVARSGSVSLPDRSGEVSVLLPPSSNGGAQPQMAVPGGHSGRAAGRGEAVRGGGREGIRDISVPLPQPHGEPKTALKNAVCLKHTPNKPQLQNARLTRGPEKPMTPSSPLKDMP